MFSIYKLLGATGLLLMGIAAIWYVAVTLPRQENLRAFRQLEATYRSECKEEIEETEALWARTAENLPEEQLGNALHLLGLADESGIPYKDNKLIQDCVLQKRISN